MKQVLQNERGMALALAIVALVVVGALIAGAFFSGTQEQRVAENVRRVQASFGVAEEGVYDIIRVWPNSTQVYNAMYSYPAATGRASSRAIPLRTAASKTGSYSGTLYKFNGQNYLIDMTAQDTMSLAGRIRGGGASQRVGLLTRIRPLQINAQASLTAGGGVVTAGNASIDGNDHTPTGWANCPPLDSAKAGIRVEDSASVSATHMASILGQPPVLKDPTLTDSSFSHYGDITYPQLAAMATITLPAQNFANSIGPVVTNGVCDPTANNTFTNWGDPLNPTLPCGTFFPIIHITGDGAIINGLEGQGILLVDGSLSIQGGFQFFGIVIIKGSLKTAGGGGTPAHFWGTVETQDTVAFTDTTTNITGSANLLYSKCAILKALNATGFGTMVRSRGWVQLY